MENYHPTAKDLRFLRELYKVVLEHISEKEFNVAELALLLGLSRVTLHRRIRTALHKPAGAFIREIRLEHAAKLLREGEHNIHIAAEHSGFYNQSYFSKCFREVYGVRPSEYLKSNPK